MAAVSLVLRCLVAGFSGFFAGVLLLSSGGQQTISSEQVPTNMAGMFTQSAGVHWLPHSASLAVSTQPRLSVAATVDNGIPLHRAGAVEGFSPALRANLPRVNRLTVRAEVSIATGSVMDIESAEQFDSVLEAAGDKLVVVDYSTSWCGPCKLIAPKYAEFSKTYDNAVFLSVMGDKTVETKKLLSREGVRTVPTFHLVKNKERVDQVSGARVEQLEEAIKKHS